jgi:hypothetical protein
MENINNILDKYFSGTSTLDEENIMKEYFNSGNIATEHLVYEPLFKVFETEAGETCPTEKKTASKPKHLYLRKLLYTSSGVAAAVLLTLWLFGSPAILGDYAIVNGTRINDHEIAQQIAQSKINKVGEMLQGKLKPLESLQCVRDRLAPAKKFFEIKDEISDIKQQLNFE